MRGETCGILPLGEAPRRLIDLRGSAA